MVVHEEHLPVAAHLEIDGVGNHLRTEHTEFRLYRIAVWRRRLDDTEVARTHQAELQGSRYGRGGKRQRIHTGLHLAQPLLRRHTELLFLVDDKQTEVLKFYGLSDKFMRPYQYIYLALLQVLQYLARLLSGAGAAQVFNAHGEVAQALRKSSVMLVGKYRSRHHHRYLFAIDTSLECRTDSHFRLAEADITTHQPVHRLGTLHVVLHILRCPHLVGRILVEERRLQLVLHITVGRKLESAFLLALGIQTDKVARYVLYLRLGALLQSFPCATAQTVQFGWFALLPLIL